MKKAGYILLFLMGFSMCFAQEKEIEKEKETKTTFNFGGFIKLSYLNTLYNNGDPSQTNPIREFNFPAYIPVGPDDQNFNMDVNAKETRFHFDVKTVLLKKEIRGYIEMDFMFSKAGDDKVSNGYNPRLRHAFFEFDKFLIGQSWSTFMIVVVPDDLDFASALEGMVFVIQPQVRYKVGSWWFALENAGTFNAPYQGSSAEAADADFIPDVTVRKNFKGDWGSWSIAAIGRALHKSDSITSSTYGLGITTGGRINTGEKGDDFRIVATYGSGIGRYQASAFIPDAVLDQDNHLKPINTLNGFIAYNHYWKPEKLSSSFNVGAYKAFHDENLVSPNINALSYSASANLKWDPVSQLRLGLEYMYSYRGLEGGIDGDYHRVQFAMKYFFNYRNSIMNEKR